METSANKSNRVAMVTGATGAIGKAIARLIASLEGYTVVLACRDERKARSAQEEIIRATGNPDVRYEIVDVSRYPSIQNLVSRWVGPLHVLVNNAATTPRARLETPEGIELQFATNVLGYFWMMEAFAGRFRDAAPARVVNVASYWAGGLDMNDLEFKRRRYNNDAAYRQSKQADRMLTVAFAEFFESSGVTVNACHPGDVNSRLSNDLGFGGHETPEQGSETPVWLATSNTGGQVTGRYFEHLRETRCRFGEDNKAIKALYLMCASYRG